MAPRSTDDRVLPADVAADVVGEATPDAPETLIGRRTPGQFFRWRAETP